MGRVRVLAVPWDSGHRGIRMGAGPIDLLDAGLVDALRGDGHDVGLSVLDPDVAFPTEVATTFELARRLSREVTAAVAEGARPVVLSGGCFNSTGTAAGLGPSDLGVVWFDAHGDLNTAETTASGFVDGTAAATLLGRCWTTMSGAVPGFEPVAPERMVYVGLRDLDRAEEDWLAGPGSSVGRVAVSALREGGAADTLGPALERLADAGARRAYVHVDIDVLDPSVARVNAYQAPDGLTLEELVEAIALVERRMGVAAGAVTSFDPEADAEGRGTPAAVEVVRALAR